MTPTLIAVDPAALARLEAKIDALEARLSDAPQWHTRRSMAAQLGVSVSTVSRMAARGELEVIGAGSGCRYRREG